MKYIVCSHLIPDGKTGDTDDPVGVSSLVRIPGQNGIFFVVFRGRGKRERVSEGNILIKVGELWEC